MRIYDNSDFIIDKNYLYYHEGEQGAVYKTAQGNQGSGESRKDIQFGCQRLSEMKKMNCMCWLLIGNRKPERKGITTCIV